MNPKVSICIPTYNRKDYLRQTLDSVYAQTYKDYEVVVVDDGSTDGTGEMIQKASFPNLRYYRQENAGDAAARNKLIDLARGQFITFIDSDDLLMPDAVERMIKVMQAEGDEVIVYGPYLRIDENGNVFGKCKRKLASGFITTQLFENILVHSCGSMFPKKALQEAGGFATSLRRCSVYKLLLQLSLKYKFMAVREPVFKRRRHPDNLLDCSSANRKIELDVLEDFYYYGGGKKKISPRRAMKRFSEEEYRAGRCAVKENKQELALQFFSCSFRRYPNIKSAIYWIKAVVVNILR